MLAYSVALFAYAAVALGAQISGVFTSIDSILGPSNNRPVTPSWQATVLWLMPRLKNIKNGDTFTLHMPYVFKFTSWVTPLP